MDSPAPGTRLADRYVLEHPLGAGAMGSVYAARDAAGTRFAVKALLSRGTKVDAEERRSRFLREAALCATVRHPNVVPVLDHGIDPDSGVPYLVMPLLEGEDLASLLDRVGTLEPRTAVALVVQACDGLAAAHARGIVHRDVKPSNLFLVHHPAGDRVLVQVTDFGLAKAPDAAAADGPAAGALARGGLTATGRFMGTPQYVSPEQAVSAKHVDARTDVYGLAMSLYHALCGRPAFAYARSFMGLVLEVTGREAPPLQEAARWVAPALARIVHAALLRDPAARCPSACELALALETAVGIDGARAPVTPAALRPISDATRLALAPQAELAQSWDDLLRL